MKTKTESRLFQKVLATTKTERPSYLCTFGHVVFSRIGLSLQKYVVEEKHTKTQTRQDKHTKIFALTPDNTFAANFRGRLAQLLWRRCMAKRFKFKELQ